ncbi:type IV secretion system protein [Xanthomonas floridensis]|nr:type IV secretion system protein [Xanthomonas floridensis]MEA5124576.1 type IV secretion system protein [Xanthomonas floridensis]MEA5132171.1 type IV secretion system protein [Xanthomonas floridensis]
MDIASTVSGWLPTMRVADGGSIGDFFFFQAIIEYLRIEIYNFGLETMRRLMVWVGGIALTLMTLWILLQGYLIITGKTRDSMMSLVTGMARGALVVMVASSMGMFGQDLHQFLAVNVPQEITGLITGNEDETAEQQIDQSLAWMQVALTTIDALQVVDDKGLQEEKATAMWMTGIGTGGPALTAAAMLLLYQVAIAMFVGFGPLFILCLLFDQTKQLFQKWLLYGIGTMFSMGVLAAMVSICMKMVVKVAGSLWAVKGLGILLQTDFTNGITSQAMQTGGMGVLLTLLILTTPPMAAFFFQGTLGSFMAYSQIGGATSAGGSPGPQGQAPGSYTPSAPRNQSSTADSDVGRSTNPVIRSGSPEPGAQPGMRASGNFERG